MCDSHVNIFIENENSFLRLNNFQLIQYFFINKPKH